MSQEQPKKNRSGTKWSEADYRRAGWHQVKVRLGIDTIAMLDELSADYASRGECLAAIIAEAHARHQGRS